MPRLPSPRAGSCFALAAAALCLRVWAPSPAIAGNAAIPDLPAQLQMRGPLDASLQLEVFINDRSRKLVAPFARLPGGRFAATRKELAEVGVKTPAGPESAMVALDDIPGAVYRYDELRQAMFFQLPAGSIAATRYSAVQQRLDAGPAVSDFGVAVNYDAYATSAAWGYNRRLLFGGGSLSLDARAFSPVGSLSQTGVLGTTLSSPATALRLDTRFETEDADTQRVYRAGDFINGGLPWTRPVRLGGLQVQRDFAMRPDLVTGPLASASGTAAVPSSVDVYVNNFRVFTQQVDAGPFRIDGLPSIGGSGQTTLVVHDVTGKEVKTTLPFFVSSRLLAPGVTEYSGELGFARTFYGVKSFSYERDPVGSATLRGGFADWATAEFHAEGGRALQNAGAGVVLDVFDRGIVDVALAGSHSRSGTGLQIAGGFSTALAGVSLDVASQRTFGRYGDLAAITAPQDSQRSTLATLLQAGIATTAFSQAAISTSVAPPRALDRLSLGVPDLVLHAAANVSFVNLRQSDGIKSRILSAGLSRTFPNRASVFASAYYDFARRKDAGVFAGLSLSLTDAIAATTQANARRGAFSVTTEAARQAGEQPGDYGWRLIDSEGANRYRIAQGTYQSQYGRGLVSATQYNSGKGGSAAGSAEFAGSVAALGGTVRAGPAISDSVALVDAGAPGVTVMNENRFAGTTDRWGKLLVTGLRGHQLNKLSIDPDTLPLDAKVVLTETTVNPRARSGVVADFKVATDARDAEIILVLPGGAPVPAGASGSNPAALRASPATTDAPIFRACRRATDSRWLMAREPATRMSILRRSRARSARRWVRRSARRETASGFTENKP